MYSSAVTAFKHLYTYDMTFHLCVLKVYADCLYILLFVTFVFPFFISFLDSQL